MALLLNYDLYMAPSRDYSDLYKELKRTYGWWHYLDSTWILATNETPDALWNRISKYFDDRDRVLIIEILDTPRQGWLPKKAWEWLHNYLAE